MNLHFSGLRRATATAINQAAPDKTSTVLTLAGFDQPIPVVYGEDRITGLWLVRPYVKDVTGTDHLRFALAWSWGECEGVQAVYLNGQAVSSSHMTHYTGTDAQTADPTLSTDIAGFADAYAGIAYTVFDIPAATYDNFPQTVQIECVFRGRKVYDERTDTTAWSENPGLCMADWISDDRYGPGLTVTGAGDVADRCDELVGGVEVRSEIGYTLRNPLTMPATLALFAAYAECLYQYDSSSVLLVPDAPVDSPAVTLTTADYQEGSLIFRGESLDSVPTEVTVTYRESSGSAEQWPESSETVQLAGVDVGEVAAVRSDLRMPGIRRGSEARRKALLRLRRLGMPGRFEWTAFDDGVKFDRGDVVQLPDSRGLSTRLVRIMDIEMVELGLYRIEAEPYSDSVYPDDYEPGSTTTVPVGGILPYIGSGTPAGYSDFTAANGRFLVGAGSTWARGATFGSTAFTVSGTTSAQADHGAGLPTYQDEQPFFTGDFNQSMRRYKDAGGHAHNYSVAQDKTPQYAQTKLIVKTGSPGDVPANGGFWADGEVISSAYSALTVGLGRLARAGSAISEGGSQLEYALSVALTAAGAHNHLDDIEFGLSWDIDYTNIKFSHLSVGNHQHPGTSVTVNISIPRKKLAHYVAGSTFEIVPGAIIGFDSDAAPPAGWEEAGTIDFWIERSSPGDAGDTSPGTRQAAWSGTSASGGAHSHKGSQTNIGRVMSGKPHDFGDNHTHTLSGAVPYDPPSYAMRFIQYTGVV